MVAHFTPDKPIVSAEWLVSHLNAPDVRVLDCTYFMPGSPRTGRQVYDAHHIPGARFFDIDDVADTDSTLPHMLPAPEKFSSRVRRMGLGDGHRVICYDQNGFLASARVWWMFRVMGHGDVAVLDGGFEAWRAAGGGVEDLPPHFMADRHFTVRPRRDLVRDLDQMKQTVDAGGAQIVDARSAGRFNGTAPEPRPGLRGGRMPGSFNVPYGEVLTADHHHYRTHDTAFELFKALASSWRWTRRPHAYSSGTYRRDIASAGACSFGITPSSFRRSEASRISRAFQSATCHRPVANPILHSIAGC